MCNIEEFYAFNKLAPAVLVIVVLIWKAPKRVQNPDWILAPVFSRK